MNRKVKGKSKLEGCLSLLILNIVVVPDLLPFLRSFVARYSASAFVGKELCADENLMNAFENAVSEIGKEMTPGLFRVLFPSFNKLYLK